MRILLVLLLVWPLAHLPAAESAAKAAEWVKGREQVRKTRASIEKGAAEDRHTRAAKAATVLTDLLAKAPAQGGSRGDQALIDLIAGVHFLDPKAAEPLRAALEALPEKGDPAKAKAWNQTIEAKRKELLRPTERLFKQALDAAVPGIARDCIDQTLVFWPDHRDVRRNLGEVQYAGRWYGPQDQLLVKQGLVWDQRLGWIVEKDRARYDAGEYFDPQEKVWTTIDAANHAHATAANRWVIRTEHLQVQGTAPLADLVDTANRLEAFYDQVFAAYCGFFVKPGAKSGNDIRLLFGLLDHPRLVVNMAKDREAYQASLPPMVKAGWSDGMFISSTKESYFYTGWAEAVYHEFTHQILHVFTDGNRSPAWLAEGSAVYTQAPEFTDGRMRLGGIGGNNHLRMFIRQQQAGKALTLQKVLALDDGFAWMNSTTPDLNYPAAGAVVQFCMEAEDRRYRSDFIDFLRDSYRSETRGYKLWEYLGMDYATFDRRYATWVDEFSHQTLPNPPAAAGKRD